VTGVDRTGFEVATERVGPDTHSEDERRPVVFYTAWPGEGGI
jgi:hypothetical protein